MLITRLITAIVMIAVIAIDLMFGGQFGWNCLIGLLVLLGLWEWSRLTSLAKPLQIPFSVLAFAVLAGLAYIAPSVDYEVPIFALSSIFWLLLAPSALRNVGAPWLDNAAIQLMVAALLIGAAGACLIHARAVGVVFLLSLLAVVWIADVAAYLLGKAFGKNKLAPKVSPGKSWEGAWSGVVAVLLYGWTWVCLAKYLPAERMPFDLMSGWPYQLYSRWNAPLFTLWLVVLTALSIVGDLFESLLKRRVGVKDSSQLLPGHGGVLDRIDAQLSFLPLAILLLGVPK